MINRLFSRLARLSQPAALSLCLIASTLWMLPRFGRADSVFGFSFRHLTTSTIGDAEQYIYMVEWFRGGALHAVWPWALRPVSPWLASLLPMDAMSGLALVGLVGALAAVAAVFLICRHVGADIPAATIATLCFGLSFPMFYYSTVGMVDGISLGLSAIAVLLTVRRQYVWCALAMGIAVLNKETTLATLSFVVPMIIYQEQQQWHVGARAVVGVILAALAGYWISRNLFAAPLIEHGYWKLWRWSIFLTNFERPRFYLTQIGGLGVQSFIVIALWLREFSLRPAYWLDPWKLGLAGCGAIMLYSMQDGMTDGRYLWFGQIFTSVVMAKLLSGSAMAGHGDHALGHTRARPS